MKITKIEIKHFRGFPGPAVYAFDLEGGKNLLLFGENGSGKSSLYHALFQLLNTHTAAPPFNYLTNLFGRDDQGNNITDGHVTVHLDGPPPVSFAWTQNSGRPSDPILLDAAMRKGFLEYRSLLQTNLVEGSLDERLFRLAVESLLVNIPVPLGGTPRTIGQYWGKVRKPATHHIAPLQEAADAINGFNVALRAILPDVQRKASELLDFFTNHHLKLTLNFDDLYYDKATRVVRNQELRLRVEFNDLPIPRHEVFLNEARLSALALALFLASVILSNPVTGTSVSSPLRLLVLDDVLIGLDLSNRLPLLRILEEHFAEYQVILSTYDRVWFEMARLQTLASGRWTHAELFYERTDNPGYEVPLLRAGRTYIEQAREHYAAHDYRAAAVYARAAFETKLKKFCDKKRLLVPYRSDGNQVSSEDLWRAVTSEHGGDRTCHVDAATKATIESLRKSVLNPLSHSGASSITKAEVDAAITAVQALSLR